MYKMPSDQTFLASLRRAMISAGLEMHTIDAIIPEVQAEWGGDRPYIPRTGEADLCRMSERDEAIRRDYQRGERVNLLVRRYKLSRGRIYQIVRQEA